MANCFNIPKYKGQDVSYDGPKDYTTVDIDACDSLEDVVVKALDAIETFEPGTFNANEAEIDVNTQGLSAGKSVCAASLLGAVIEYETAITGNTIRFGYDLTKATSNLPSGHKIYQILVETKGTKGTINRGTSISSGFNLNLDELPVRVDVRLTITTSCGLVDLTKIISIPNSSVLGKYSAQLDISDQTTAVSTKKLKDILGSLYAHVAYLENSLQSTTFVTTGERVTELENSYSDLSSIYLEITDKFSYNGGNFVLQDIITSIENRIKAIENTLTDYNARLIAIEDQLAIP